MYGAIAFVGRDAELDRLHDLLQRETPVAICAVSGMGGIGKTELALQYALKHRDLSTYPGGICWLRARQEVKTQLVEFARSHLGLDLPLDLELEAKVQQCWRDWRDGETLIVFDDVQQYDEIRDSLPPARSRFKVMLTARSRLGRSFRELHLEVLSEAAALDLLRSTMQDERIDQQLEASKQICQWLGYLPLGLESIGQHLVERKDLSLTELWQQLRHEALVNKGDIKNVDSQCHTYYEEVKDLPKKVFQQRQVIYPNSNRHEIVLKKLDELKNIQQNVSIEAEVIREIKIRIIHEHINNIHKD